MSSVLESNISNDDVPTKNYPSSEKSVLKSTKKKDITIVLVGGSGSGRSSFMSLLVNLLLGVKPLELVDRHDPNNESAVTLHKVTTLDSIVVQILDTPDLSTKEEKSVTKIKRAIRGNIQYIDAIIIVANGHTPHMTTATLSAITDIFPRTVVNNIGCVFPNSGWPDWKFQMDSLPLELRKAEHWIFHNPHAALDEYEKIKKEKPDEERRIKEALDQALDHYKLAVDTLNEWVEWVDSRDRQLAKEIPQNFDLAEKVQKEIKVIESKVASISKLKGLIEERDLEIKKLKDEAKGIRSELDNTPDMPTWRRLKLEERLRSISSFVSHYEGVCEQLQCAIQGDKVSIETAQREIRRFVDNFYRISYSQNFTSGANATIKILEGSKTKLESIPDTEAERGFIDEIVKTLKDKLPNASEL